MANKYPGITPRGKSIQIAFTYKNERCRETLKIPPTPSNLKAANRIREGALRDIQLGTFDYAKHFPNSKGAVKRSSNKGHHITIESALIAWLREKEQRCEKSTIRGYSSAVYYYLIRQFGSLTLGELKRGAIIEWIDNLDISNKRKNNVLIPLRGIYKTALQNEQISFNPLHLIDYYSVDPREPQPFTRSEITAILNQLQPVEKGLIQFAFWTGLRTSELIALKWENVDIEKKRAYIRDAIVEGALKGTKTTAGIRTIELHPEAIDAISLQHRTENTPGYVFIDPKSDDRWKNDQVIRKRVWIPALKRAKVAYRNPYQTRHTYASMMFSEGRNLGWLQNQMGHSDWGMLRKVYARWLPSIDNKDSISE